MKPHQCKDSWVNAWRLMLARLEENAEAYNQVLAEIDCPVCLRAALETVVYQYCGILCLRAGSLSEAAEVAAKEIYRMVMP